MEMKKFWDIVKIAEWPNSEKSAKVERKLREAMTKEEVAEFRNIYEKLMNKLDKVIDGYINKCRDSGVRNHGLPFGGDDSFGDMLAHVIGLGEAFYNEVIADPKKLIGLNVVESFGYVVPYAHDDSLDPDKYLQRANKFKEDIYNKLAKNLVMQRYFAVELALMSDMLNKMAQGRYSELPENGTALADQLGSIKDLMKTAEGKYADFQEIEELLAHPWYLPNILTDAKNYLG